MKRIYFTLLLILLNFSMGFGQEAITLLNPYHQDTIDTKYPLFNWHYLNQPMARTDVKYTFTLVELNEDQSAQAGIAVNTPLFHIEAVQGFQLSYPFDAPELEYNHRYGWRLQRKENGVVTTESEAWEFILYKEVKIPMKYAVLNTDYNSTLYRVNDKGFYFKLNSRYYSNAPLNYQVLNSKSERVDLQLGEDEKLGEDEELEKTGRNFYYIKTSAYPKGIYTLKVLDPKGNEYNTRFQIK